MDSAHFCKNRTGDQYSKEKDDCYIRIKQDILQFWHSIGIAQGLTSHSDIASFLVHRYIRTQGVNVTTRCIQCGSSLISLCFACNNLSQAHHRVQENTGTKLFPDNAHVEQSPTLLPSKEIASFDLSPDVSNLLESTDTDRSPNKLVSEERLEATGTEMLPYKLILEDHLEGTDTEMLPDKLVSDHLEDTDTEMLPDKLVSEKHLDGIGLEMLPNKLISEKCLEGTNTEILPNKLVSEKHSEGSDAEMLPDKLVSECLEGTGNEILPNKLISEKCLEGTGTEILPNKLISEERLEGTDTEMLPDKLVSECLEDTGTKILPNKIVSEEHLEGTDTEILPNNLVSELNADSGLTPDKLSVQENADSDVSAHVITLEFGDTDCYSSSDLEGDDPVTDDIFTAVPVKDVSENLADSQEVRNLTKSLIEDGIESNQVIHAEGLLCSPSYNITDNLDEHNEVSRILTNATMNVSAENQQVGRNLTKSLEEDDAHENISGIQPEKDVEYRQSISINELEKEIVQRVISVTEQNKEVGVQRNMPIIQPEKEVVQRVISMTEQEKAVGIQRVISVTEQEKAVGIQRIIAVAEQEKAVDIQRIIAEAEQEKAVDVQRINAVAEQEKAVDVQRNIAEAEQEKAVDVQRNIAEAEQEKAVDVQRAIPIIHSEKEVDVQKNISVIQSENLQNVSFGLPCIISKNLAENQEITRILTKSIEDINILTDTPVLQTQSLQNVIFVPSCITTENVIHNEVHTFSTESHMEVGEQRDIPVIHSESLQNVIFNPSSLISENVAEYHEVSKILTDNIRKNLAENQDVNRILATSVQEVDNQRDDTVNCSENLQNVHFGPSCIIIELQNVEQLQHENTDQKSIKTFVFVPTPASESETAISTGQSNMASALMSEQSYSFAEISMHGTLPDLSAESINFDCQTKKQSSMPLLLEQEPDMAITRNRDLIIERESKSERPPINKRKYDMLSDHHNKNKKLEVKLSCSEKNNDICPNLVDRLPNSSIPSKMPVFPGYVPLKNRTSPKPAKAVGQEEIRSADDSKNLAVNIIQVQRKSVSGASIFGRCIQGERKEMRQEYDSHQHVSQRKEKTYHCSQCPAVFYASEPLKRHFRIHSGEKPYDCEDCGAAFTQSNSYKVHKRIHTGEKPYHCEECGRAYRESHKLKLHQLTHIGEKPHVCLVCKAAFRLPERLKKHLRIHTGEKPYVCKICDASFNEPNDLKRHTLKHTGEKPHICKECGGKFTRSEGLQNHIRRIHLKVKPYKCTHCASTFADAGDWKAHEKIHSEVKSFQCVFCDKKFTLLRYLKQHEKNHLKKNEENPQIGKNS